MDKLTKYILDQLILYILTGSGILALFRAILWMQGLRIVSFYRVYRHKKEFYSHPVFAKIRNVIHARHFLIHIKDIAKKELAQDLIALEVQRIRQTLRENLKHIYKQNLFSYLKSYKNF
ncbi:MAG: hypothetical protein N3A69_07870 [Leptospiraceae bacterium]|nr:hypothetical protein [Leptospiraceae bacterium]